MGTSRVEAETRKPGQPRDPSNNQIPAATRQGPPNRITPSSQRPDAHSKTGAPERRLRALASGKFVAGISAPIARSVCSGLRDWDGLTMYVVG